MAGQRLTDKTALEQQTGSGDLFMVVDVNDTTGSAAGTSKKIDSKYVIQTDKFSLNNAEVLALDSTPKTLIGALSGYMPTIFNVTVLCTYAASTESARKDMIFGFDESNDAEYWSYIESCMDSETSDNTYIVGAGRALVKAGSTSTSILNKPFLCWAEGTGFNGGWSCDIYVTYAYTKVL
jgi:hypothetical protein